MNKKMRSIKHAPDTGILGHALQSSSFQRFIIFPWTVRPGQAGWTALDQVRQGEALLALGLAERLYGLQLLPPAELPQALQRREALLRLVDPSGLGDFRWILFGKGVNPARFKLPTAPDNV